MTRKLSKKSSKKTKKKTPLKKKVTEKKKPGQKGKYKPEYSTQVFELAKQGFTEKEIAEIFSVTQTTITTWKKKFPVFLASLKGGRKIADQKVVESLYQRATGYSHPEVHITNYKGNITKTNIIKHYPPDPTSMIFWLKNRKPDEWRDKQERVHEIGDRLAGLIEKLDGKTRGLPE